jgi:Fe-S-cluster-containing hydrogenase component 2
MTVKVDEAKCTGCGDCTETCPSDALKVESGKVKVDAGECSECAACVDVCPEGSLSLD